VRHIVAISLLLLGLGMLSCEWDGTGTHSVASAEEGRWVRTADGWERSDSWELTEPQRLSVHPIIWATGQGLMSIFALVAWPNEMRRSK
jgi:hypothetical protein